MSELVRIITSDDPAVRDVSIEDFCRESSAERLLAECETLNQFRRESTNLYHRIRAVFFIAAIHRFYLPDKAPGAGLIPYEGYVHLLNRKYEEAVRIFLGAQGVNGPSEAVSSALAAGFRGLAFEMLANQVRQSVRSLRGNQWMFRSGHTDDYPLRLRAELLTPTAGVFPVLAEATPVRMDLSHSGWSDIFFLGMDFPEGARVLNVSIDLNVRTHQQGRPKPPIEAYFRVIDEPALRLVSVDLKAQTDISSIEEVFDFARDHLGLLKAAVIASGLIPPALEGASQSLADVLARLTGTRGHGVEIITMVNDIPKGSRLAVSTSLLACVITACMRATNQISKLTGGLDEEDRRLVAARAILGEWMGGSGGGWQDSGGVWPAIKIISGVIAEPFDVEYNVSRGCLLPRHQILGNDQVSPRTRELLQDSLVLVHGGMAQDVGPVLEMVTEKYLLRSKAEWQGRQKAMRLFDDIVDHLRAGNIQGIGASTQANFDGPIQTIIPWAANHYTDQLIQTVRDEFQRDFHGFWMLGGMSGGGMGFIFDPSVKAHAQDRLAAIMGRTKRQLEPAVPFAMDPVVYNFAINENGTTAQLVETGDACLPSAYYTLIVPDLLRRDTRRLSAGRRVELERFGIACDRRADLAGMASALIEHLLPRQDEGGFGKGFDLALLLEKYGFDAVQHEKIRSDLKAGRIGLAQNALPVSSRIEDVSLKDVCDTRGGLPATFSRLGTEAIRAGAVAVVSLAGGVGTRWTKGAGVVKAINPFSRLAGKYRTFIEVHLAKTRKVSRAYGVSVPHIFTTSYMTHEPIAAHLAQYANYGYKGPVRLSAGRSIGLRLIPMTRDLRFAWEEMPQQVLDEQKQKVRESQRAGLIEWAIQMGEGADYRDNIPMQCLHPVGHWYEIPNLLMNGVLAELLDQQPQLQYLLLHNIDTLGATLDPGILGAHIDRGVTLTTEVIPRVLEDHGGGLASVSGKLRLVEGMAFPDEKLEFVLSFYNSGTMWIHVDGLLRVFGLRRADLSSSAVVAEAVRGMAAQMPTYVTLKDVKKRWGKGQEDIFPITQFEKLWGDMTGLADVSTQFVVVPRQRGQQLKDVAQLDGWMRDGSALYVESLCEWN